MIGENAMARVLDMRGRQYIARNEFDRAEKVLAKAVDMAPANPEYRLNLGWAILQNREKRAPNRRLGEARAHLEEACVDLPWSALARYRLSQFWREFGHEVQYRRELEATLRCDPNHYAANRELGELNRLAEQARLAALPTDTDEVRQGMFASLGWLFRG